MQGIIRITPFNGIGSKRYFEPGAGGGG